MKCFDCEKELTLNDAYHCKYCDCIYCPTCAKIAGLCSCYGEIVPFN